MKASDFAVAENMHMKRDHSVRVSSICRQLAIEHKLDVTDQEYAALIGLLHDVGRFDQFGKYKSFDDSTTEDHAALGVAMITEAGFYQSLGEEDQQILVQVIENHNKFTFTAKDRRIQLFGHILRDADKLDNWELAVSMIKRDGTFELSSISYNLPRMGGISEPAIKALAAGKCVNRKDLQSLADFKLFLMSMVYDLNLKASFSILSEKQLIKKLYDSMTKRDDVIDAYRTLRLYIENKLTEKEPA